LFLWHLLGLFGTDPAKLHQMLGILKSFLPSDPKVQEILDTQAASVVVTGSSGTLANVGIFFGIWLGTLFISTISHALSRTHGVVEDRNWWSKYIIAFFLLFWFGITTLFCFNAMVFGEQLAGVAEVNFQLTVPLQEWVAFLSLPDRPVASVTLASRDPTPRSSRDSPCSHRRSDGLCSCPVDERRKEKESARRNARRHFADPFGNAGADREAKTGRAKVEIEK